MSDTRLLNWRLIVPDDGEPLLLLPVEDESIQHATVVARDSRSLRAALLPGLYRGVVVSDLSAWHGVDDRGAAALLERLAALPGPGGWLYVGFPNAWFPSPRRGAVGLRRALRIVRSAGLTGVATYVALPSQRRPAWLVPVERRAELDVVLRRMVFPYAPLGSPLAAGAAARLLRAARRAAVLVPHRLRVRFAPAYAVVARRPA